MFVCHCGCSFRDLRRVDASHCHLAFVVGRTGFEKLCTNPGISLLGQLG